MNIVVCTKASKFWTMYMLMMGATHCPMHSNHIGGKFVSYQQSIFGIKISRHCHNAYLFGLPYSQQVGTICSTSYPFLSKKTMLVTVQLCIWWWFMGDGRILNNISCTCFLLSFVSIFKEWPIDHYVNLSLWKLYISRRCKRVQMLSQVTS